MAGMREVSLATDDGVATGSVTSTRVCFWID